MTYILSFKKNNSNHNEFKNINALKCYDALFSILFEAIMLKTKPHSHCQKRTVKAQRYLYPNSGNSETIYVWYVLHVACRPTYKIE